MSQPETTELLVDTADHVTVIHLHRPHRRNAITPNMLRELSAVLTFAEEDAETRAVVLTGSGAGFCAGLDIKDALSDGAGQWGVGLDAFTAHTRNLPTTILNEMDTPVIAALNGAAAGYGLDLALGCDLRIAGTSTRLLPGFAKRGAIPESGGTWYLPRLVGWARAAEIAFLGRDLDSAEADRLGLVNLVVPDDELVDTARAWALEIAANAPLAVRAIKRLFRHGLTEDFPTHTHHMVLQGEALFRTKDFAEGLFAWAESRAPKFKGR